MAARKYKIFDEINAREAAKPGGATAGGGGSRPAAAGVQPIAGLDETLKAKAADAQRLLSQATLPASPLLWNDPARARLGTLCTARSLRWVWRVGTTQQAHAGDMQYFANEGQTFLESLPPEASAHLRTRARTVHAQARALARDAVPHGIGWHRKFTIRCSNATCRRRPSGRTGPKSPTRSAPSPRTPYPYPPPPPPPPQTPLSNTLARTRARIAPHGPAAGLSGLPCLQNGFGAMRTAPAAQPTQPAAPQPTQPPQPIAPKAEELDMRRGDPGERPRGSDATYHLRLSAAKYDTLGKPRAQAVPVGDDLL